MSESSHNETQENQAPASPVATPQERILSVDVLRGFDMFWLVGGAGLVLGIIKLFGPGAEQLLAPQLEHAEWEGFHFYDLIFPLFVYMIGMSLTFSLGRLQQQKGTWGAYKRLLRRFVLMFLMGVFYYGGMQHELQDVRWLGVLQRLALCYLFGGIIYLHFKPRGMAIICAAILIIYWLWLSFVPVPGVGHPSLTWEANWAAYVDSILLPGHPHYGTWDPEGLLSTIPSVASCLLGVFAGLLIKDKSLSHGKKFTYLLVAGTAMVILGFLWGLQFPVIKRVWTSSYVLVAGGYSTLLLAFFLLLIDILKIRFWVQPFIWIGANSLTIYMARNIVDFNKVGDCFVGGSVRNFLGEPLGYLAHVTASFALSLLLVHFLYKKKIFLRL